MPHRLFLALLAAALCAACNASAQIDKPVMTAPGRLEAGSTMPVGAAVSGVIAEVLVHAGDRVTAGQLLVRISCATLEKELDVRKGFLASAQAAFERAVNGPRPEEIGIGLANVGLAEARSEEAGISLHRATSLLEGVTISKAQLDQAKRDARMAAALLDEARARLALLKAGSRPEDIAEARARRDMAQAQRDEAVATLDHCTVRAPGDGVVLAVPAAPGQFISTAIPATLVSVIDDRKRFVRAEVDERDVGKACVGQHAAITADAFPGTEIAAVAEALAGELTHRTLRATAPEREGDAVRAVTLGLAEGAPNWPLGLRVLVKFAACPKA
ncbi:MAG: efflux RND transporter periplasmic adaptor subunit [Hyphomicrobiales bacterium]|nr:efflux RND transporter periplasmic adaptor subunit [Hyphomicrobiales bacterium]MBV8824816.1 efflux RND transporter periplasmic adaptor subunit [Hyphomicrobiales bacterium]MBV9426905.1 efflux RND transporter periplasmic adaptor subunit [Bradyrhizobiaceae bacterium]